MGTSTVDASIDIKLLNLNGEATHKASFNPLECLTNGLNQKVLNPYLFMIDVYCVLPFKTLFHLKTERNKRSNVIPTATIRCLTILHYVGKSMRT